jgi:hypothetical protein
VTRSGSSDERGINDDGLIEQLTAVFAGTYQVEAEMRGGGMSRLFLATDAELSRRVVIKILPIPAPACVRYRRFRSDRRRVFCHQRHIFTQQARHFRLPFFPAAAA